MSGECDLCGSTEHVENYHSSHSVQRGCYERRPVQTARGLSVDYLLVFCVAFVIELCATGYTLSIAKERYDRAIAFSVILTLLNAGVFFLAMDNRVLLAPSALGEILGTVTMLRFGHR